MSLSSSPPNLLIWFVCSLILSFLFLIPLTNNFRISVSIDQDVLFILLILDRLSRYHFIVVKLALDYEISFCFSSLPGLNFQPKQKCFLLRIHHSSTIGFSQLNVNLLQTFNETVAFGKSFWTILW